MVAQLHDDLAWNSERVGFRPAVCGRQLRERLRRIADYNQRPVLVRPAKEMILAAIAISKLRVSARERRRFFRSVDRRVMDPTSDLDAGRRNALRSGFWRLFRVAQWPDRVRRPMRRSLPGWLQPRDPAASPLR